MKPAEFSQHWNQQATAYPSQQCLIDQILTERLVECLPYLSAF